MNRPSTFALHRGQVLWPESHVCKQMTPKMWPQGILTAVSPPVLEYDSRQIGHVSFPALTNHGGESSLSPVKM